MFTFVGENQIKKYLLMKKVLFALVLIGGIFAMSSCSKECNCTVKLNGTVLAESSITLDQGEKCSDYSGKGSLLGVTGEVRCTPKLF